MTAYALRRVLLVFPTLLGISLLSFALVNLTPGDPAEEFLRRTLDQQPTPSQIREARTELGLDRPLPVQFVSWVGKALQGDLGVSYSTRRSVAAELLNRMRFTLQLTVPAALLALVVATSSGVLSAVHHNRLLDQVLRVGSLAGASMPSFWLALLLILLFSIRLSMLPVAGRGGLGSFVLPVVTLAVGPAAVLARFTRSTMLEALSADHVTTAKAKGVTRWSTVLRHGLRNSLIPLVTAFGMSLGFLLSGAAVIETIFVWPGIGKLAVDAILQRDVPIIQGFVLYTGAMFAVINLVVDLSYGLLDPRVSVSGGG